MRGPTTALDEAVTRTEDGGRAEFFNRKWKRNAGAHCVTSEPARALPCVSV